MINKAILIGNLGKDPDIKSTNGGKKFARLSVATTKKWKRDGEWEERTQWHTVVVWNEYTAKYLESYAAKGSRVYVEGEIETRKYDKDGEDKYVTEIVVSGFGNEVKILDSKGDKKRGGDTYKPEDNEDFGGADDLDDEIPF